MTQQVIHFSRATDTARARRARDEAVRSAQRRAFEEMLASRDGAERRRAVRKALDAFLDACETGDYISA